MNSEKSLGLGLNYAEKGIAGNDKFRGHSLEKRPERSLSKEQKLVGGQSKVDKQSVDYDDTEFL